MNLIQQLHLDPYFPNKRKSGCYIRNKEIFKDPSLANYHLGLPLIHIDYHIQIANGLASVTLIQKYRNPTEHFLETQFSFPIHPEACIYKFVSEFGKNRVQGIVKEKQQAKNQYRKAVQSGNQAAFAQIDPQNKENLNLEIGNIQPGQEIYITISYLQELSIVQNTLYQFKVPAILSPNCMKNIREKTYLESEKNQKQFYTWSFKATVISSRKLTHISSESHPNIKVLNQNQEQTQVVLCLEKDQVPNKDFSLVFTVEDFHLPSYVLGRTDHSSTVMLSFIPKFSELSINDAIMASREGREFQVDLNAVKGQYIFLLDRSGSMEGNLIEKAKQALEIFLRSLPPNSYFNVISFGSQFEFMFQNSKKYEKEALIQAITKIKKMKADLGGTEVFQPLKRILETPTIEGYPKQIFLLTDGQVSCPQKIYKMVRNSLKFIRCHSIGIGNGYSQEFIEKFAEVGKGKHTCIKDSENPCDMIVELLNEILTPVIENLSIKFDQKLVESISPNPKTMGYILKNELVNFYITFKGQLNEETLFQFSYQDSMNKQEYKTTIKVDPESGNMPFVDKMGHKKVIQNLEKSYLGNKEIQDHMHYVKVVDKKKQAIDHSIKHQIISKFTAMVCVVNQEVFDVKRQQMEDKGRVKIGNETKYDCEEEEGSEKERNGREMSGLGFLSKKSWHGFSNEVKTQMKIRQDSQKVKNRRGSIYHEVEECAYFNEEDIEQNDSSQYFSSEEQCASQSLNQESDLSSDFEQSLQCASFECSQRIQSDDEDYDSVKKIPKIQKTYSSHSQNEPNQQLNAQHHLESKQQVNLKNPLQNIQVQKIQQPLDKKPFDKDHLTIQHVITHQNLDGSFTSQTLFNELFSPSHFEIQQCIETKNISLPVAITYLIMRWIENYYLQKQYQLIIKKAQSYIKQQQVKFTGLQCLNQYIS